MMFTLFFQVEVDFTFPDFFVARLKCFKIFFVFATKSGIHCYYLQPHSCRMIAESTHYKAVRGVEPKTKLNCERTHFDKNVILFLAKNLVCNYFWTHFTKRVARNLQWGGGGGCCGGLGLKEIGLHLKLQRFFCANKVEDQKTKKENVFTWNWNDYFLKIQLFTE